MHLFLVLLAGMAINNHNAERPVKNIGDLKHAVEVSFENPKPLDYSKMNK